jgi:hypothetical protein
MLHAFYPNQYYLFRGFYNGLLLLYIVTTTTWFKIFACTLSNETWKSGVRLLQSRICSAVNDFMASFPFQQTVEDATSLDLLKRLLRLQIWLWRHSKMKIPWPASCILMKCYATREEVLANKKQLQEENHNLIHQQSSQSLVFRREMSRRQKKNTTQQDATRQLVAIHVAQFSLPTG